MHEIASVIIEKIKANLSMSGTFGESIFQSKAPASFPRKQIVGQGSRIQICVQGSLLLLLNTPLDFECILMQEWGGGAKEDITQILVIR